MAGTVIKEAILIARSIIKAGERARGKAKEERTSVMTLVEEGKGKEKVKEAMTIPETEEGRDLMVDPAGATVVTVLPLLAAIKVTTEVTINGNIWRFLCEKRHVLLLHAQYYF